MEIHLKIVGLLLIVLALMHIAFPKRFDWKTQMAKADLLSRQIMYVHTFFIGLMVFLMGLLSFFYANQLVNSSLGQTICIGLTIFWLLRLIFQLFVYSPTLWKGKRFETIVHIIFTLLWVYITGVYLISAQLF